MSTAGRASPDGLGRPSAASGPSSKSSVAGCTDSVPSWTSVGRRSPGCWPARMSVSDPVVRNLKPVGWPAACGVSSICAVSVRLPLRASATRPPGFLRARKRSIAPSLSKSPATTSSNAVCGNRSSERAGSVWVSKICTAPVLPIRRHTSSGKWSSFSVVTIQNGAEREASGSQGVASVKRAGSWVNRKGGVKASKRASAPWKRSSFPSRLISSHSGMRVRPGGLSTPNSAARSTSLPPSFTNSRFGSLPLP